MSSDSTALITAIKRLEQERGILTDEQAEKVRAILQVFMSELRDILREGGKEFFRVCSSVKHPCSTCALNPSTDSWPGFLETSYGLFVSLRDNKTFICHDNQETWQQNIVDTSKLVLCGSFAMVSVYDPEATHAVVHKAMTAIDQIAPLRNLS